MQKSGFVAVCPVEIGDTLIIKAGTKEAYYIPDGVAVQTKGTVEVHVITDISTTHYLRDRKTVFRYELDNSKKYIPLEIRVPNA